MIRSMLTTLISYLSGASATKASLSEEVEPLYRSYAFPTVPSSTDRLFDEAERRTENEKPLRLLDLPVI